MTSKSKTEAFLRSIKLPVHAASYTVIPHAHVIDKVKEELANNNFVITEELYKASTCGNVALGFMKIETETDSDMSMTFNWINSYNKQLKFGCAIGGFIHDNKVPIVSSINTEAAYGTALLAMGRINLERTTEDTEE